MWNDFILNGQGNGPVGAVLGECRFDAGLMRPFIDDKGRKVCTVNTGRTQLIDDPRDKNPIVTNRRKIQVPVYETHRIKDLMDEGIESPVFNAASLRHETWIEFDKAVVRAARLRLRAWADLAAANSYTLDGMSRMILETEAMSDAGTALVDLDGMTEGRTDSPLFQPEGTPLPITHSDFFFSERRLRISRNGTPLDTTMAEMAGFRVAEMIERTTIGTELGITYGDSTRYSRASSVYGYLNFPGRMTKTDLTTPTGSNPEATVQDILEMRDQMYDAKFTGPYIIYTSTDWDRFLDNDYARLGGNNASQTLRNRIRAIEGIADIRRLDYLRGTTNPYTMIMVQMTANVARAIIGMPITTIQWQSQGGMRKNFKVMCIQVPQIREDFNGNCGVLQATTA